MARTSFSLVLACALVTSKCAMASTDSIGVNGINSAGLLTATGTPLTGAGIGIGQVEVGRPGDPSFDSMGTLFHSAVNPAGVYYRNPGPTQNFNATMNGTNAVSQHAVLVAGVMISSDISDPDMDGDSPTGIAPSAMLYSIGDNGTPPDFDPESAVSAQHLATAPSVNM